MNTNLTTDQKLNKMAEDMVVCMNNSARILSELTSQQQQISATQDAVRQQAIHFAVCSGAHPESSTAIRPIPPRAVPIPPVKQKKGVPPEKAFKEAVIDLIRSEWRKSPVIGAPEKTEDAIKEAYRSMQTWSTTIAGKCAPNLFQLDADGKCQMTWSKLYPQAQDAFINELVTKANEIGVYLEHCKKQWVARRFLQIAVNSKGRSIKKNMPRTAGNLALNDLSMPDDSMSFASIMRGA
jgi:hypothetical protein